jgi:hypothetical protein
MTRTDKPDGSIEVELDPQDVAAYAAMIAQEVFGDLKRGYTFSTEIPKAKGRNYVVTSRPKP